MTHTNAFHSSMTIGIPRPRTNNNSAASARPLRREDEGNLRRGDDDDRCSSWRLLPYIDLSPRSNDLGTSACVELRTWRCEVLLSAWLVAGALLLTPDQGLRYCTLEELAPWNTDTRVVHKFGARQAAGCGEHPFALRSRIASPEHCIVLHGRFAQPRLRLLHARVDVLEPAPALTAYGVQVNGTIAGLDH